MTETPYTTHSGFQSFAFDDENRRIYYLHSVYGASIEGAVVLSYLNAHGSINSDGRYIRLNGFGHGQSMSVEVIGNETWIWMECNSLGSWFGTSICRFKWTESGPNVFDASDLGTARMPGSVVYTLRPGATINQPYIDFDTRRLLLFYATPDRYLDLYDLDEVKLKGNDAVPLNNLPMMTLQPDREGTIGTFQGMAFSGDYAYFLSGATKSNAADACLSPDAPATHLHYQNMIDGSTGWSSSLSGQYLPRREPEGMAIQNVSRGRKRLVYGYSCYAKDTTVCGGLQPLTMALFYKDHMVSG